MKKVSTRTTSSATSASSTSSGGDDVCYSRKFDLTIDLYECYEVVSKDPRFQDYLFKYMPQLSSISGALQKARIAFHPSHIPLFGVFAKVAEAVDAGRTKKRLDASKQSCSGRTSSTETGNTSSCVSTESLEQLEVSVSSQVERFVQDDIETMCMNSKAFLARKSSRATLSFIFLPLGGALFFSLRKSLEKSTEVATEKAQGKRKISLIYVLKVIHFSFSY